MEDQEPAEAFGRHLSHDSLNDVEMQEADPAGHDEGSRQRFIVAIDFGTTFSSVSYISLEGSNRIRQIDPDQIETIEAYPDAPNEGYESRKEVPTESWYPKTLVRGDFASNDLIDIDDDIPGDDVESERANAHIQITPPLSEQQFHTINNANVLEEDADDDNSKEYYWGYEVQEQLLFPDTNRNQNRRIARSKLLLDTSEHTENIRNELSATLQELTRRELIKRDSDVIADFLTCLFRHTRDQLKQYYKFHTGCKVEIVLCVPAMWTQKACRTMQTCMAAAITRSEFCDIPGGSVDNLFIVSEPEAAAARVLASHRDIKPRDIFILLDAGGGTVDAITYMVHKSYPLRLKSEAVKPGGALCGSSYLNEAFQQLLERRLEGERYLEDNGLTINGIVNRAVVEFENKLKRNYDITKKNQKPVPITIERLRADPRKNFQKNRLVLSLEELKAIFMPVLEQVANLLRDQLRLAREKNLAVKKVILMGGFAASPSLRNYLQQILDEISSAQTRHIELVLSRMPGTAVAVGAVLRALRKEDGPARIIQSSYGFLRTEPYEPDANEAHRGVHPWFDPLDGMKYVKNTIFWFIKKGDEIPSRKEYLFPVSHVFPVRPNQQFLCREILYVSDEKRESSYRKNHADNQGAEIAGWIQVDMTFLRKEGRIQPVSPAHGLPGKKHYKVEFELVIIVDGRNLRYEVRYPLGEEGQVRETAQTSIAAAFVPGTQ